MWRITSWRKKIFKFSESTISICRCNVIRYMQSNLHCITRESDVRFFIGLESTNTFKAMFDYLLPRSSIIMYQEGAKKVVENSSKTTSSFKIRINAIIASLVYSEGILLPVNIPDPQRETILGQNFLMTRMRLRLGLLIKDLSCKFKVSPGHVSQIWITWLN